MNTIARDIRTNRTAFESIVNDFRAYWGKVYRGEVTKSLNDIAERLKTDPKNEALKAQRYALEQVCAKIKGLNLSDDIKALIVDMHDNDKLSFSCLTTDYIVNGLKGLDYVGPNNEIRELRKKDKEATEKTWEPVVKWTEAKVGRYFRLATVRINEQSK